MNDTPCHWGLLVTAFSLISTFAQATEHVVRTDAEFAAVQSKLQPGDIVRLGPGVYGKLEWTAKGTAKQPIRVIGISRDEFQQQPDKRTAAERRIQQLSISGAETIFSGLRFVGQKGDYSCVNLSGSRIRLTDCSFDACASRVWVSTHQKAYECEIDHCSFLNKDFQAASGQTMRLFAGESKYPAGHVVHHNQFGPKKTYRKKNGNETIQPFHATKNPGLRLGGEEDMLIMCNLFTRSASENEMLSAKCDSVFFLLNTLIRDKETTLRTGRNHTIEACWLLVNTDASRSCGANNLYRNNYHHYLNATHKLWGKSKGYSGARQNWIVNNTFMFGNPYTAQGTDEDITVVNNVFGRGYQPNPKQSEWTYLGNMAAMTEDSPSSAEGVAFHPIESLLAKDNAMVTEIKDKEGYKPDFIYQLVDNSKLIGAAMDHEFVGGIDPRGNPVPSRGANVGCFQVETHNIFQPYQEGDLGPFTQIGEAPLVRITTPSEEQSIDGKVEVKVEAADAEGKLAYVYLMLNNQPVSVDTSAPYEWTLDTMLLAKANRIRAVAFDADGNTAFHRVNVMNQAASTWIRNTSRQDYQTASDHSGADIQ